MNYTDIEDVFVKMGGKFHTSAYSVQSKLQNTKAYIFDWDGVFNEGRKGMRHTGSYSEIDTVGVKMLRFAHFLMHHKLALVAIFCEQDDALAKRWGKREGVNEVYTNVRNKSKALSHFCNKHKLEPSNVLYVFDDVMDVAVAREAGIRLAVGRENSPVFLEYLKEENLVDYVSGNDGNSHAVREHCELLMMLYNKHNEVIERIAGCDFACLEFEEITKQTATEIYSYGDQQFNLST